MATTRRTTLLLDGELLDRLDGLARRERTTKTALVHLALDAFLAARETRPALRFVGIGRSGHGRLSLDGRSIVRRDAGRRDRPARPPVDAA